MLLHMRVQWNAQMSPCKDTFHAPNSYFFIASALPSFGSDILWRLVVPDVSKDNAFISRVK